MYFSYKSIFIYRFSNFLEFLILIYNVYYDGIETNGQTFDIFSLKKIFFLNVDTFRSLQVAVEL